MNSTTDFIFEVLVIDKTGQTNITKGESLVNGILFSEKLWISAKAVKNGSEKKIIDEDQKLEVEIFSINTTSMLNGIIESAFVIRVKGSHFEKIEAFRYPLIIHLRKTLAYSNIRILRDDVSTKISNDIYPLINLVENLLRRYLVMFFIQKIGIDWWEDTATKALKDKVSIRKGNEKVFSNMVDTDLTLTDFDDLGELIYKQTTGFNRQESIISRVMSAKDMKDLNELKQELQGNYTKYFKETFQNNNFDRKWKILFEIRNRVAHNNLFVISDLVNAQKTVEDLCQIINVAENSIESFNFSVDEKIAIREATIEASKSSDKENVNNSSEKNTEEFFEEDNRSKFADANEVILKVISETELIKQLDLAERSAQKRGLKYLGQKIFVNRYLETKGYELSSTYSLISILKDKGIIDIYDVIDDSKGFPAKAIRIKKSN